MQITVTGRHMAVSDPIREYAEEKFGRVGKITDHDTMTAEVVLHVEKNPSNPNRDVAEVTLHMKGMVVRAEEAAPDMYAAIDLASDKLERQLRRYKTKMVRHRNGKTAVKTAPGDEQLAEMMVELEGEGTVVRTKVVDAKPMTHEEAILQLELLGHDFFVFTSADTGDINVLYRRTAGDFGLIEPQR